MLFNSYAYYGLSYVIKVSVREPGFPAVVGVSTEGFSLILAETPDVNSYKTLLFGNCENCYTQPSLWGPVSFYSVAKSPPCSKCVIHVNYVCVISRMVALIDMQEICLSMVYS